MSSCTRHPCCSAKSGSRNNPTNITHICTAANVVTGSKFCYLTCRFKRRLDRKCLLDFLSKFFFYRRVSITTSSPQVVINSFCQHLVSQKIINSASHLYFKSCVCSDR